MKKYLIAFVLAATIFVGATQAKAVTVDDLWNAVASLTAQVADLKSQLSAAVLRGATQALSPRVISTDAAILKTAPVVQTETKVPVSNPVISAVQIQPAQGPTSTPIGQLVGKVFLLGGHNNQFSTLNDVWSSTDMINWTLVSPNSPGSSTKWHGRQGLQALYFNNKIWVMGGRSVGGVNGATNAGANNDVWYSSDGTTWTQATAHAAWGPRFDHTALVFQNKMWVIAGNDGTNNDYKDAWYSTDGINWTLAQGNAAFGPRSGHSSTVFQSKMWVIGGSHNNNTGALNDTWSSTDGITWTVATNAAAWTGRAGQQSEVFKDKIWNTGDSAASNGSDEWSTSDGITWNLIPGIPSWANQAPRNRHESIVFKNKLWVLGGFANNELNDVWGSTDGTTWTQSVAAAPWAVRSMFGVVVTPMLFSPVPPIDPCSLVSNPITVTVDSSSPAGGTYIAGFAGNDFGHFLIKANCPVTVTQLDIGYSYSPSNAYGPNNVMGTSYKFYDGVTLLGASSTPVLQNLNGIFQLQSGQTKIITVKIDLTPQATSRSAQIALTATTSVPGAIGATSPLASWFKIEAGGDMSKVYYLERTVPINGMSTLLKSPNSINFSTLSNSVPFIALGEKGGGASNTVILNNQAFFFSMVPLGNGVYRHELWKSSNGLTWTQIDTNPNLAGIQGPPWSHIATSVVVNQGYIYAIGGWSYPSNYYDDIWRSSDGVTWTQLDTNPGLPGIQGMPGGAMQLGQLVSLNGIMFATGGYNGQNNCCGGLIWSSADGITWQQLPNLVTSGEFLVHNNKIYILNGGQQQNAVYSSPNGINWTLLNSAVPYAVSQYGLGRYNFQKYSLNGKMWVVGGTQDESPVFHDIWSSPDGITWNLSASATPPPTTGNEGMTYAFVR